MKNRKKIKIFIPILFILLSIQNQAQQIINAGNVKGTWGKEGSPYLVFGDINIAIGDTLKVEPGVKIVFQGSFLMNIQGTLDAKGSKEENIIFISSDTTHFTIGSNIGWGGLRFDKRDITWDTAIYIMTENEDLQKMLTEQISKGTLDTTPKITLCLSYPDIVYDTLLSDSVFNIKTGSQLEYCQFKYGMAAGRAQPYVFGGAIYIYRYSNLIINNCLFNNNAAFAGGALYCKEASPIITNCTFKNCNAQSSGGAMVFVHSGPIITNCDISGNGSGYNGGGILFYESSPYVLANKILKNKAVISGGGIFCEKEDSIIDTSNKKLVINKQIFQIDSAFAQKSIVQVQYSTSFYGRFLNNVICNNNAMDGGGVGLKSTDPEFTNNTISENIADSTCGGMHCNMSSPSLTNSIIYNNKDTKGNSQVYLSEGSSPNIQYCNIESGMSGIKKDKKNINTIKVYQIINSSPYYESTFDDNYALTEKSKCIDAGNPAFTSMKLPSYDLTGKNRIVNNKIDLGAIEYSPKEIIGKKDTLMETELKSTIDGSDENVINDKTNEIYTVVYPNPTDGVFSIAVHNNIYENISIKIYSSTGQFVYKRDFVAKELFEQLIDLSDISKGFYILLIYSNENILYNGELVINH